MVVGGGQVVPVHHLCQYTCQHTCPSLVTWHVSSPGRGRSCRAGPCRWRGPARTGRRCPHTRWCRTRTGRSCSSTRGHRVESTPNIRGTQYSALGTWSTRCRGRSRRCGWRHSSSGRYPRTCRTRDTSYLDIYYICHIYYI